MRGWQQTIVLFFLVLLNFWTFVLLFLPIRGSLLYTLCVFGLRPFALLMRLNYIIYRLGSVMRSDIISNDTGVEEQRRSFNFDCYRIWRRILTGKKMKNDDGNICNSNDNNKKMKTVLHWRNFFIWATSSRGTSSIMRQRNKLVKN